MSPAFFIAALVTLSLIAWMGVVGRILDGAEGSRGRWGRRLPVAVVSLPAAGIALDVVSGYFGQ